VTWQPKSLVWNLDLSTGIAVIRYNSPKRLNSWTPNFMWEYVMAIEQCQEDPRIRVMVTTGEGRAFSAGNDWSMKYPEVYVPIELRERMLAEDHGIRGDDIVFTPGVLGLWDIHKPTIVAVNGLAVGGATNLALLCHDFVIAAESAKFQYPFIKLCITPELSSSFQLPIQIGMLRTKELVLLGKWFSAQEAKDMGLCSRVVPDDKCFEEAMELARHLSKQSASALSMSKKVLHSKWRPGIEAALKEENQVLQEQMTSPEFLKAMADFSSQRGGGDKKPKAKL